MCPKSSCAAFTTLVLDEEDEEEANIDGDVEVVEEDADGGVVEVGGIARTVRAATSTFLQRTSALTKPGPATATACRSPTTTMAPPPLTPPPPPPPLLPAPEEEEEAAAAVALKREEDGSSGGGWLLSSSSSSWPCKAYAWQ
jgi:hypothetical protein